MIKKTKLILKCLVLILISVPINLSAQVLLEADGPDNTYNLISSQGFGIENPDCVHTSFGEHITEAYDNELGKNVFIFHSHINDDNDRCSNFDRVRTEIKGGSSSPSTLQHTENQMAYYRWKFRLASTFQGTSSFCHIFQIKAYGGDAGAPIITITARASIIEIIHSGGDTGNDEGRLTSASLSGFLGTWVEGYVRYESSESGDFEIILKRVSDGQTLLSYNGTGLDLWRDGNYNRPKWGVYRKKATGLNDEQVKFADFCVSESAMGQCPTDVGSINTIANGTYAIKARHSGKAIAVEGSSTANNANIFQYAYGSPSTYDEWEVTDIGEGYYSIINSKSGKALSIDGGGNSKGMNAKQYIYTGWSHQKYEIVDIGDGYYSLKNGLGFCINVEGAGLADGDNITQNDCSSEENQQWSFTSVDNGNPVITGTEAIIGGTEGLSIYPNPLDGNLVNIRYTNNEAGYVRLAVYNSKGQSIVKLVDGHQKQGNYVSTWNTSAVPAGIYLARVEDSIGIRTVKLVIAE